MKYDAYFVEGLDDKTVWNELVRMLVAFSDTFSLITFKYRQNEKASPTSTKIGKALSRCRIGSRIVKKWPSTEILGDQKHIYRMTLFRIELEHIDRIFSAFEQVGTLWDWDYPDYPMDPCFYKNGYAWFSVSTHEHECQVFLEKEGVLQKSDIESIGVTLIPAGSVDQSHLFRLDDDWTGFHEKTPKNESKTSKRKTVHIDSIMEMLDWENPLAVQEEGIRLAERVENFNVFIQPCNKRFHKNVWDNCAKIISSKTDEELLPYLSKLFMWLQDLNWPGALTICERLLEYKDHATFDMAFDSCMKCARALNDSGWEENLLILEDFDQYFPNRKLH